VIDESGASVDTIDVRKRVGVQVGFVLTERRPVVPKIKVVNERGEVAFNALDPDPRWREPSEPGRYLATAWIPANLLNEGVMTVDVEIASVGGQKLVTRSKFPQALAFHVQDPAAGDSAKGHFVGQIRGAVRPKLDWTCEH